jgi:hypothetical protein
MPQLITLREWWTRSFDDASRPHYQTVLLWAKNGVIATVKIGRRYFVDISPKEQTEINTYAP